MIKDDLWANEMLKAEVEEFPIHAGDHYLSDEKIIESEGRFPPVIPMIWRNYPIGSMLKGAFWLCDPDHFAPLTPLIFDGDPDIDPARTHIYAYTAFGRLVAWNEDHWSMEIDMLMGEVKARSLLYPEEKEGMSIAAVGGMATFQSLEDLDEEADDDGKWLYNRAKKKLGPLSYGECYGFAPALPLGGEMSLETVRKYDALTHFAFLAQAQDFVLKDYLARPIREIRPIGAQ